MGGHTYFKYNPGELPLEEVEAAFVGRDVLLQRLLAALREQDGAETVQHYLILGPRGIGKTTLLLMLQSRIKTDPELAARWFPVRYREEEFYVYTLRDLMSLALESLCNDEGVHEAGDLLTRAEDEPDDDRSLAAILDGLKKITQDTDRRLLLLIDNFDRIFPKNSRKEQEPRTLRKLLSTESFLMVIGTSTFLFEDIFDYDKAFYNFFSPVTLENLDETEINDLILTRARLDENLDFLKDYEKHRQKVRVITYLTGGNPRLALMLYDILSQRDFLPVVQALRETMDNLTPLLKDVLESLPRQQTKVLDTILRLGGAASPARIAEYARLPLNTVTTQLGRLKQARMVEVQGEGKGRPASWRVQDPMFRTWYQMRYLRPARRRVEMFVEFLRAWFPVEERLASLDSMQNEFDGFLSQGLKRHAANVAMAMEYHADSLEEDDVRRRQFERVADAYIEAGDMREAAPSLAELKPEYIQSESRHESSGFTALGDRLLERSDMDRAKEAYTKALEKDPESIPARIGLAWCYGLVGDHMRALEAFTILSEQPGLDVELLSRVLVGRGFTKHQSGDLVRALSDYTAVLGLDGAPPDSLSWVLRYRGAAYEKLGRIDEALADYGHCVELSGKTMYSSFSALVNLLCREGRTAESIDWLTRLEDLEPDGTPMEARLDARVELITQVAKTCSMDEAVKLLDVLLETSSRPIRERLAFLKPGLEYALDGDESRLSALPTEEREIAERIAATIKKAVESPEKGQDGKQPI